MPELQITLGRQCKDYGISEEYSPQNPINELFANIGDFTVTDKEKEILREFVKIIVVNQTEEKNKSISFCWFAKKSLSDESKTALGEEMEAKFGASEIEVVGLTKCSK